MKPNREGSYVISRSGGRGSYTLDTLEGNSFRDNGIPTTFGDTILEALRLPARLLADDEPTVLPLKTNCFRCKKPYLHCRQAAHRSTTSMESFSSAMSPTYAHRRQAIPPFQTRCSSEHKLNGLRDCIRRKSEKQTLRDQVTGQNFSTVLNEKS
ncbi:hypothetical protein L3X38_018138 [Prunus dulcis]|uniref:Uncharacterized protein n=1 Tax=Prunus dulcis TaxID=3755 RepID=A0AAD4WB12_PRUDU|nr:hypothetical protein L3X38_018138 [Prunus dulcis]